MQSRQFLGRHLAKRPVDLMFGRARLPFLGRNLPGGDLDVAKAVRYREPGCSRAANGEARRRHPSDRQNSSSAFRRRIASSDTTGKTGFQYISQPLGRYGQGIGKGGKAVRPQRGTSQKGKHPKVFAFRQRLECPALDISPRRQRIEPRADWPKTLNVSNDASSCVSSRLSPQGASAEIGSSNVWLEKGLIPRPLFGPHSDGGPLELRRPRSVQK